MLNLQWAISTVKKCYVAPGTIDMSILNDTLAFQMAITTITNAVQAGEITNESVYKQITEQEVVLQ